MPLENISEDRWDGALPPTPGQTIGPFFGYATAYEQTYLPFKDGQHLVPPGHPRAVRLTGTVRDGHGDPIPDALLEIWQTDEKGRIPRETGSLVRDGWTFTGWGRTAVDHEGTFTFSTVEPGPTRPGKAPFIHLVVFARGLPNKLHTRIYLPGDTEALEVDPLLASLDEDRRSTLVAHRQEDGSLSVDVWLQGLGPHEDKETVFLQFPGIDYPQQLREDSSERTTPTGPHRAGCPTISSQRSRSVNDLTTHGHTADSESLASEADVGLLDPLFAGTRAARLTSDTAFLGHLLDVEATWAEVLADAGMIPGAHARAARSIANPHEYDLLALARSSRDAGNPLIPTLRAMREQIVLATEDPDSSSSLHIAATSQDVVDTAMMRMVASAAAAMLEDARTAVAALDDLARDHRETLMVARTLGQHALPTTFGLRAAGWSSGLARAGRRLEASTNALPLQWGGAAGTMAALHGRVADAHREGLLDSSTGALDLVDELAARTALRAPAGPWQGDRTPLTAAAAALAELVAACGKIAEDVLLSTRAEIGELEELRRDGQGRSSSMPHKRNPVLSVLVRSAALAAPGTLAQVMTAAGASREERSDGSWHAEWSAVRRLLRTAGGAAARTAELASGLRVFPGRMAENLERSGPLLLTERLLYEIGPRIDAAHSEPGRGARRIQQLIELALSPSSRSEPSDDADAGPRPGPAERFRSLVRSEFSAVATEAEIERLLDPREHLGEAGTLVDRMLREHERWYRP